MMKSTFLAVILLASCAGPLCAVDTSIGINALHPETKNLADEDRSNIKWATFLGREIENEQGDNIGHVTDLALDMKNGRIAAVIVAPEDTQNKAVRMGIPPGAFDHLKTGGEHGTLLLRMGKDKLVAAPRFELTQWHAYFLPEHLATVFRYFGVTPYFGIKSGDAVASDSLGLIKATHDILGLAVWDETICLGQVKAIRVDAKSERLLLVLAIETDKISSKSEILASEVQLNDAQDALMFDRTKQVGRGFNRPPTRQDDAREVKAPTTQADDIATTP